LVTKKDNGENENLAKQIRFYVMQKKIYNTSKFSFGFPNNWKHGDW